MKSKLFPLFHASVAVLFSIGSPVFAADLTWTGVTNGTWDTSTGNWTGGSPTANLYNNATPDAVLFNDTGANKTVSLASGLTPASVTVNNSIGNNYTFQTNGFGGSGSLLKQGTGVLTLAVANTYSGGTTISAGTLQLNHLVSAGSSAITLNDAGTGSNNTTLNFSAGNVNYANAIMVANQGSGTTTLAFTTASNNSTWTTGAITLNKATTFTASSATNYLIWSSASLSGSGPLTIGSTNGQRLITSFTTTASYTGDVTVGNGTNATVFEPRAAFSQNNFTVNALSTLQGFGNMTINGLSGGGTVTTFNTTGNVTLGNAGGSGIFSGSITNGAGLRLTKTGIGTQTLSGTNTYTGTTTVNTNGGTLQFAKQASLYNGAVSTAGWIKTNIIVNSGGTLALNVGGTNGPGAGEFTAANVTTLLGNLTTTLNNNGLRAGSAIGFDTTNAAGGIFTIANNIANSTGTGAGALGLTKLGINTLELTGTSSYTGATTVSAGTLLVNGSLGDTAVTVADGATIGGTGIIEGSLSFAAGAKLNIGDIDNILTVEGGVTFANFSITDITGWDFTEASNDTYTLFNSSDFDLDNVDYVASNPYEFGEGRSAYFEAGPDGLNLVVIPEPTAALLGSLGMLCLLRRRRN